MRITIRPWDHIPDPHPDFLELEEGKRTEGWHVASLLKDVLVKTRLIPWKPEPLEAKEVGLAVEDGKLVVPKERAVKMNTRMLAGVGMEPVVLQRVESLSGTIWRPGEVEVTVTLGKVYGTPDGFTPKVQWPEEARARSCIEEVKATWTSMRRPIEGRLPWLWQMGVYCRAHKLRHGRLTVVYMNGGYEKHVVGEPRVVSYYVEYEKMELDSYLAVLNHGIKLNGGRSTRSE